MCLESCVPVCRCPRDPEALVPLGTGVTSNVSYWMCVLRIKCRFSARLLTVKANPHPPGAWLELQLHHIVP